MRSLAIEALGTLGSAGPNGQIAKGLCDIAADGSVPPSVRRAAVQALGELKYAGASGVDPALVISATGKMVRDLCSRELQGAKSAKRLVSARLLKAYTADGLKTLTTLGETFKTPPSKPLIDALAERIQDVSDVANEKNITNDAFSARLAVVLGKLGDALDKVPAAAPPAPASPATVGKTP